MRWIVVCAVLGVACTDKGDDDDDFEDPFGSGDDTGITGDDTGGGGGDDTGGGVDGWQHTLTHQGGCADTVLFARNDDDTLGLYFQVDGVALETWESGGEAGFTYLLPDEVVTLQVWSGEHVTHAICNDALEYEPSVEATWVASGGYAALYIASTGEPTGWGEVPSNAQLTLDGVTFESTGGDDPLTAAGFTLEAAVGWLPG